MHKAEALPAATQARHGASWASGQLPAAGGAGGRGRYTGTELLPACAATPLWHPLALAVFARWPGLLPAWLLVRNVLTAHLTLCSVLQQGRRTSS